MEPGAFVEGNFNFLPGNSQSLEGRGLIYGAKYEVFNPSFPPKQDPNHWYNGVNFMNYYQGNNYLVEGSLMVRPNGYCYRFLDRINVQAYNIKCMEWRYSSDGGEASYGSSSLTNSFFKQNDDTLCLYSTNGNYKGIVIYKQSNGAVFQLGWGFTSSSTISNNVIQQIDVVSTGPVVELGARSVFSLAMNNGGHYSNFLFEDIQITGNVTTIFGIDNFSPTKVFPAGTLSNFQFKNISISGTEVNNWYVNYA